MSRLRLTVTQLRVLILGVNFILTGAVGAHVWYRYRNNYAIPGDVETEMTQNPEVFRSKGTSGAEGTPNVIKIAQAASGFIERRQEPVVTPVVPGGPEVATPEIGPGELPPGPLEEEWEYDGHLSIGGDGGPAWGIIRKKTPGGPTAGGPRPVVITNNRNTPRIIRSPTMIPGRRNPATAQLDTGVRMLKVGDWFQLGEEGEGPIIKVLELTSAQFVYGEHGKPARYALKRKIPIPIIFNAKGEPMLNFTPPEPDPNSPPPPQEEETRYFVVGGEPPSSEERLKAFLEKQESGSTAAPGGAGTKPLRPPAGASPKTQAEQLKELRSTINQIPEAERKKLNDILRKSKTIQQNNQRN